VGTGRTKGRRPNPATRPFFLVDSARARAAGGVHGNHMRLLGETSTTATTSSRQLPRRRKSPTRFQQRRHPWRKLVPKCVVPNVLRYELELVNFVDPGVPNSTAKHLRRPLASMVIQCDLPSSNQHFGWFGTCCNRQALSVRIKANSKFVRFYTRLSIGNRLCCISCTMESTPHPIQNWRQRGTWVEVCDALSHKWLVLPMP